MDPSSGSTSDSSLLRHRPFAFFWCARVATSLAFQMQAVAVGWQGYALTGSAFYLGLIGLAQFLPMFIGTSNQLGEFESGVTAAVFGVVPAAALGGVGTIAVSLLWWRLFPELARIDSLDRTSPEEFTKSP